ncbi:tRNA (adenine(22)-N(1))-methyltransferase [Paenibacillus cymbidii]|uniref:tRNA (adenine(22)-N(1))-methyltransferase n=1 Tax=Paenibacillus cymbidii TaxID=1639034 RepID=UPI001081BB0C|nr:class I SAM-dependent methyltransferase [Paenibacillus cymbidii]
MIRLSSRLQTIANKIERGSRLADIGSDHALLPVFLAQQGVVRTAIAGELNPGPFEAARKQVREAGLERRIDVRRGDGLSVLKPGEADTVTIAGMGGGLIVNILTAGKPQLAGVNWLVLQPNVGEELVRRWLLQEGWLLREEDILEEDGKIYEVLCAVRLADAERWNEELYRPCRIGDLELGADDLLRFGPRLVRQPAEPFVRKWQGEIAKLESIAKQMAESQHEQAAAKRGAMLADIDRLRRLVAVIMEKGK